MQEDEKYDLLDVIPALALAGIHSAKCPQGIRNAQQSNSGMYFYNKKCECWVGYPTEDQK